MILYLNYLLYYSLLDYFDEDHYNHENIKEIMTLYHIHFANEMNKIVVRNILPDVFLFLYYMNNNHQIGYVLFVYRVFCT